MKQSLAIMLLCAFCCMARGQTFVSGYDCECLIDGAVYQKGSLSHDGGKFNWNLDVTDLAPGLHLAQVKVTQKSDVPSVAIYEQIVACLPTPKTPSHNITGRLFIDDEMVREGVVKADGNSNSWLADLTSLPEGLHRVKLELDASDSNGLNHTMIYEALAYKVVAKELEKHSIKCRLLVDDELLQERELNANSGADTWMADISSLPEGLHRVKLELDATDSNGLNHTTIYEALAYRMSSNETWSHSVTAQLFVDEQLLREDPISADNGSVSWMTDLSDLPRGIHRVKVVLTDNANGQPASSVVYDALCYRSATASELAGISSYEYMLNDDVSSLVKVDLSQPQKDFVLTSLLSVPSMPIRSEKFKFEVVDGTPTVFAANDIRFRFNDSSGEFNYALGSFTDYAVSQPVDAPLLKPGSTELIAQSQMNPIKWYKVEAQKGDSLCFKLDKSCTIQVFASNGDMLYQASGIDAVNYGGCHVWGDGFYYVAVHDLMSTTSGEVSLRYQHIDKYAILNWDIAEVGNGGASCITIDGNGFDSLEEIELWNHNRSQSVKACRIKHIDNTRIEVVVDFAGCEPGSYDARFVFIDEYREVADFVTVEEATDIVVAATVNHPAQYLRNSSVAYSVRLSNSGNMTAFAVPVHIYIGSNSKNGIKHISFDGLELPTFIERMNRDNFTDEEWKAMEEAAKNIGADAFFTRQWNILDGGTDSVMSRRGYFFVNIPPKSSKTFSINIVADDRVEVWVTAADSIAPFNDIEAIKAMSNRGVKRRVDWDDMQKRYCCVQEQLKCWAELATNVSGLASSLANATQIPQAKIINILDCAANLANDVITVSGDVLCGEGAEDVKKRLWDKIDMMLDNLSLVNTILGCLAEFFPGKFADSSELMSNINDIANMIADMLRPEVEDVGCDYFGKRQKPGCPPGGDSQGGASDPVNSWDPNDVVGYISKAGTHDIGVDVREVFYKIRFENDTLATAPASVVILTDTIDANVHDLASFAPTEIRIGNRTEALDGSQNFIKTIDMRPEIDCVAQVQCVFDNARGIATWTLSSLNPMTLEPVSDYSQGFLPVNTDGKGQGEVSFDISLKQNLDDGTAIQNRAYIKFDNEKEIATPTWTNVVDAVAPVSKVTELKQIDGDNASISVQVSDNRSGVWHYDVYAKYGLGSDWFVVAHDVKDEHELIVPIYDGISHYYRTIAVDKAGNIEHKSSYDIIFNYNASESDVNNDGDVDVGDVNTILAAILSGGNDLSLDVNGDKCIDVGDVNAILSAILRQ